MYAFLIVAAVCAVLAVAVVIVAVRFGRVAETRKTPRNVANRAAGVNGLLWLVVFPAVAVVGIGCAVSAYYVRAEAMRTDDAVRICAALGVDGATGSVQAGRGTRAQWCVIGNYVTGTMIILD